MSNQWCTEPDIPKATTFNFFKQIFSSLISSDLNSFEVPYVSRLNQEGVNTLLDEVDKAYMRKAMFSMQSYKALSHDGFQPIFFKFF